MDVSESQRTGNFAPPTDAVEIRPLSARVFLVAVAFVGFGCALTLHTDALWATPAPTVSVVVFALLTAIAARFGAYQQVDGLAEYASLAMPMIFAALLLFDWPHFVAMMVLAEIFGYLGDVLNRSNVTVWYIRIFNVTMLLVASAIASGIIAFVHPFYVASGGDWYSPALAIALLFAALAWKLVDSWATTILLTLATSRDVRGIRIPFRAFTAQFALILISVPFAWVWHQNVWLSLFALASLGAASRLLGVPELEHRARTDGMSGLINAQSFEEFLESEIDDARPAKPLALLALDIDHFKRVNDTFGHLIGDAVIAQLGAVLSRTARREDVAARTGGEEFSILLRDSDRNQAIAFAERLRRIVEAEPFTADGLDLPLSITVSIGVAIYPESGNGARALRRAADEALYAAKDAGRNVIQLAHVA